MKAIETIISGKTDENITRIEDDSNSDKNNIITTNNGDNDQIIENANEEIE